MARRSNSRKEALRIGGIVDKVKGGVVDVGKGAVGGVTDAGKGIGGGVVNVGKGVGGGIVNVGKTVGGGVVNVGKTVGGGIVKFGKGIVNMAKTVWTFLKKMGGWLKLILMIGLCFACVAALSPVLGPLLGGVRFVGTFLGFVQRVVGFVVSGVAALFRKKTIEETVNTGVNALAEVGNATVNAVNAVNDVVNTAVTNAVNTINNAVDTAVSAGVNTAVSAGVNTAVNAVNAVNAMNTAVNAAVNAAAANAPRFMTA